MTRNPHTIIFPAFIPVNTARAARQGKNARLAFTDIPKAGRGKNIGFTLLEVMVALSIFAICAFTLLKQSGLSGRQLQRLETRTQATWIAENSLAVARLRKPWPDLGRRSETILLGQRQWEIETEVSATINESLRRVEVRVSHGGQTTTLLTGFIGEH